jgi:hypothetical protein
MSDWFRRNLRASAAWFGTPLGLVALWLLPDAFTDFAPATALTLGFNSGQLYYLIKDIRTDADTQPENRLKKELLGRILGEAAVREARHGGKELHEPPRTHRR